jgi:hypothetical protein
MNSKMINEKNFTKSDKIKKFSEYNVVHCPRKYPIITMLCCSFLRRFFLNIALRFSYCISCSKVF